MLGWISVILDVFLGLGGASAAWGGPLGTRSLLLMILGCFWEDFMLHFGTLEGHFGGHFGDRFANRSDYVDLLVIFFWSKNNEGKRSSPGGGTCDPLTPAHVS